MSGASYSSLDNQTSLLLFTTQILHFLYHSAIAMTIALTEDNIDDILFFARTGQLEEFRTCIHEISRVKESTPEDVIAASVEETSRNSPLHMAAANGQLGKKLMRAFFP